MMMMMMMTKTRRVNTHHTQRDIERGGERGERQRYRPPRRRDSSLTCSNIASLLAS